MEVETREGLRVTRFTLLRTEQTETETRGILLCGSDRIAYTLELPWEGNRRNVSCIPPGRYWLRPTQSERHGYVLEITPVSGRWGILIHPGNTVEDTDGCILPGRATSTIEGRQAVLQSRAAMEDIQQAWGNTVQGELVVSEDLLPQARRLIDWR